MMPMTSPLRVGYATRDITPPLGTPLAGRPMIVRRQARAVCGSLSARAVHIQAAYLGRMAAEGAADNRDLSLSIVEMGRVALVGVPGEVGPELSMAIRQAFPRKHVVVASLCNGYSGYIHKRSDYQHARGTSALALYENAMSLAGRDAGDYILSRIEQRRARRDFQC